MAREAKVAAVIPARNEERHVGEIAAAAKKYVDVVLVVDDGSEDGTAEAARGAGVKVISLPKNMGKGFAMRLGAIEAVNQGAGVVVFLDADGQHRPEDIPRFLEEIEGGADVVFGRRKAGNMPLVKQFGNWFLRQEFRLLFGREAGDLLCGFKAVKSEALPRLLWKSDGYFVETELAARVGVEKLESAYVDVPSIYLDPRKGTTVWDGVRLGWQMLKLKLRMVKER